jgi:hypothetical protein
LKLDVGANAGAEQSASTTRAVYVCPALRDLSLRNSSWEALACDEYDEERILTSPAFPSVGMTMRSDTHAGYLVCARWSSGGTVSSALWAPVVATYEQHPQGVPLLQPPAHNGSCGVHGSNLCWAASRRRYRRSREPSSVRGPPPYTACVKRDPLRLERWSANDSWTHTVRCTWPGPRFVRHSF